MSTNHWIRASGDNEYAELYNAQTLRKDTITRIKDVIKQCLTHYFTTSRPITNIHIELLNPLCCLIESFISHRLKSRVGINTNITGWTVIQLLPGLKKDLNNPVLRDSKKVDWKDEFDYINSLSEVSSDVGKTRAWIRRSLSEGVLNQAIEVVTSNHEILRTYYEDDSILRFKEDADIFRSILQPLETIQFQVDYNDSSLELLEPPYLSPLHPSFRDIQRESINTTTIVLDDNNNNTNNNNLIDDQSNQLLETPSTPIKKKKIVKSLTRTITLGESSGGDMTPSPSMEAIDQGQQQTTERRTKIVKRIKVTKVVRKVNNTNNINISNNSNGSNGSDTTADNSPNNSGFRSSQSDVDITPSPSSLNLLELDEKEKEKDNDQADSTTTIASMTRVPSFPSLVNIKSRFSSFLSIPKSIIESGWDDQRQPDQPIIDQPTTDIQPQDNSIESINQPITPDIKVDIEPIVQQEEEEEEEEKDFDVQQEEIVKEEEPYIQEEPVIEPIEPLVDVTPTLDDEPIVQEEMKYSIIKQDINLDCLEQQESLSSVSSISSLEALESALTKIEELDDVNTPTLEALINQVVLDDQDVESFKLIQDDDEESVNIIESDDDEIIEQVNDNDSNYSSNDIRQQQEIMNNNNNVNRIEDENEIIFTTKKTKSLTIESSSEEEDDSEMMFYKNNHHVPSISMEEQSLVFEKIDQFEQLLQEKDELTQNDDEIRIHRSVTLSVSTTSSPLSPPQQQQQPPNNKLIKDGRLTPSINTDEMTADDLTEDTIDDIGYDELMKDPDILNLIQNAKSIPDSDKSYPIQQPQQQDKSNQPKLKNNNISSLDLNILDDYQNDNIIIKGPLLNNHNNNGNVPYKWSPLRRKVYFNIQTAKSLHDQNYQCFGCSKDIGGLLTSSRYCEYSGRYYCSKCHSKNTWFIPGRILTNWDFRYYSICNYYFDFLQEVDREPLYDITTINAKLYKNNILLRIRNLRRQMYHLKDFLRTCTHGGKDLLKLLGKSEYLANDVDFYSLADLVNYKKLLETLRQLVAKWLDHVDKCILCLAKGFICEFCDDHKPIFPFHIATVVQCEGCKSVHHKHCYVQVKCPKCIRQAKNRILQNFELARKMEREREMNPFTSPSSSPPPNNRSTLTPPPPPSNNTSIDNIFF